jgi:galactokinase
MTSDAVPVVRDLAEIYSADALQAERKRWNELAYAFETAYGAGPAWIARAPGRVRVVYTWRELAHSRAGQCHR